LITSLGLPRRMDLVMVCDFRANRKFQHNFAAELECAVSRYS
jgi:hypothetical protein